MTGSDCTLEERLHGVDLRGQLQLGSVETQLGPLLGWGQVVVHEMVDLGAGNESCGHGDGVFKRAARLCRG